MKNKKYGTIPTLTVAAVAMLALLAPSAAEAQTPKIGVFDAQRVSEDSAVGRQIQDVLTAFTAGKEAEISERQKRLAEKQSQLQQQALSLSSDRRNALEKEIQREALDLDSFQQSARRELELEYASAQRTFEEKLIVALDTFAKDEGFSLILDRSQVAWAAAAVDVTGAIVDRFDAMFPTTTDQ